MKTYILIFNQTAVINAHGGSRGEWASVDVEQESELAAQISREFADNFAPIRAIVDISDPVNPCGTVLNKADRDILGLLANCLE